ncbi:MAG: hypothetical protein WKG07_17500 [Hymenobacter sp.]
MGEAVRSPLLPTARLFLDNEDARERLYADPRTRVDQPALLRARLLDVLVGRLGPPRRPVAVGVRPNPRRPDGQLLAAVPKDRDQVFFPDVGRGRSAGTDPQVCRAPLGDFRARATATCRPLSARAATWTIAASTGLPKATSPLQLALCKRTCPILRMTRALRRLPPPCTPSEGPTLLRRPASPPRRAARRRPCATTQLQAHRPVVAGTEARPFRGSPHARFHHRARV